MLMLSNLLNPHNKLMMKIQTKRRISIVQTPFSFIIVTSYVLPSDTSPWAKDNLLNLCKYSRKRTFQNRDSSHLHHLVIRSFEISKSYNKGRKKFEQYREKFENFVR